MRSCPPGEKWAKRAVKVNAELDQLAVDPDGRLVLLELKHGKASAGSVYFCPLQLLQYVHEWSRNLESIRSSLRELIAARQAVRLSPAKVPDLTGELRPIIAFGQELPSARVSERLEQVREIANRHLPNGVPAIEIWALTEDDEPRRLR